MSFTNESSGVFGWLMGLVVIVMIGVGMSMMVDRRFQFSSNNKEIETVIREETQQLSDLSARVPKARAKFESLDQPRQLMARELDELKLRLPVSRQRIQELKAGVESLKSGIHSHEESVAAYRRSYRDQTWREAVGEKHSQLTLKSGKLYENTVIQRVTPVGLEISHRDGLARIDFTELDRTWMERFQWRFDERESTIAGEEAAAAAAPPVMETAPSPQNTREAENLERLRADVVNWNSKVSALKVQQAEALANAGSGRASVSGGLETWAAKAKRLDAELARAKQQQERARIRLGVVAPDDPLTKPPVIE